MDWASLVLRLGLGAMFTAHGLQMALGMFKGPGVAGFSKMLPNLLGLPAIFWSYLACYTCLIGGICLIIGLFTRIAVIPLVIFMLTAVALVHWKHGFFLMNGGWEYNFLIICGLIALFILGAGRFSILKNL